MGRYKDGQLGRRVGRGWVGRVSEIKACPSTSAVMIINSILYLISLLKMLLLLHLLLLLLMQKIMMLGRSAIKQS